MADGLTVPFALAAGLSGAVAGTGVIITAGVAEVAAGAIAMGLEAPDPRRARRSAWTIALSYIVGGLVPLSPHFVMNTVYQALIISVFVTLAALGVFGYVKGRFTVKNLLKSAWQTMAVGSLAAAAAFALAKLRG